MYRVHLKRSVFNFPLCMFQHSTSTCVLEKMLLGPKSSKIAIMIFYVKGTISELFRTETNMLNCHHIYVSRCMSERSY